MTEEIDPGPRKSDYLARARYGLFRVISPIFSYFQGSIKGYFTLTVFWLIARRKQ